MLARVLIFLLFLSTNLIASEFYNEKEKKTLCDKNIIFNPQTDSIEVQILKNRKWVENLFKLVLEFNQPSTKTSDKNVFNFSIKDSFKKNYKSKVKINYKKDNVVCKFDARVKITGDMWWHLDWVAGKPFASIQVKLLDGNINNIVNFKLLLPKSRRDDNEIFIVSLLRYLNFIAPRTFYTNAKINGIKKKYIFQEDLNKELLESYSLVEGPILEGDERFTIEKKFNGKAFHSLSLSRISNYKYIKNDLAKMEKSLEAISLMNKIYIQSHLSKPHSIEKLNINSKIEKGLFSENFNSYESLIYATRSGHLWSHDDRRFYYDPINNYFSPIYYDGKPKILDYKKYKFLDKENLEKISNDLKNGISVEAKLGAERAYDLVKNIKDEEMINILEQNGLKINKKTFIILKKIISHRLETINKLKPKKIKFENLDSYYNKLISEKDSLRLIFANKNIIEICNIDLSNCKKKIIKYENIKFLFAQNFDFLEDKKNLIYLFIGNNKDYHKNIKKNKFIKHKINKNFSVKHNNKIKLDINYKDHILDIYQKDSSGRAIILGKKINDWQINFFGSELSEEELAIRNYYNLTGCLTFADIKLININLFAKNSKCEDAINLIRTNGNINEIKIFNNMYDGLDIDFSSLSINKIFIENSDNDCIDLSFGKYKIKKATLKNCGDKGISIGEKSQAFIDNVNILKTDIGIASKDSSIVEVLDSKINTTRVCLSAYRKKQEFNSASIKIQNLLCDEYDKKIDLDMNSTITIQN